MKLSALAAMAVGLLAVGFCGRVYCQTPVVWDGGDGAWNSANWNTGQTVAAITGDGRGTSGGHAFVITDADIAYDAGVIRDMRLREENGQPASMTIKNGSITLSSVDTDVDGVWTQYDADLTLDNGTFARTKGGTSQSGGLWMLGSWRSQPNQQIDVNLLNGGRIENDGQLWFGAHQEHAPGLKVFMTINNGSLDLTGGTYPQDNDGIPIVADLTFFFGRDFDAGECNGCDGMGALKGEDHRINFKGPGSITVDESGLWIYDQGTDNVWTGTLSTYENLWDRHILRSGGVSGGAGGANFAGHFTVTGTAGSNDYVLTRKDPVAVVWDGGNGEWNAANWNTGQTLGTITGDGRGTSGGHAISIGGGAQVNYNAGVVRDLRPRVDNGPASITVKEGAKLTLASVDTDVDGVWTQYDADLTLDNGTLARTKGGTSQSGGLMMLGSWRSHPGQQIDVNIINGGRFENDGQLWFGAHQEHAPGLEVTMTINDGSLDLTGGTYPQDNDGIPIVADLAFFYGRDFDAGECNGCTASGALKGEKFAINFTGPGSITVDESGVWLYDQGEDNIWSGALSTYEDLWTRGILQANGMSGLTGAMFGDFFSVAGTAGANNYMLTSLLDAPGLNGDFNGDGTVDAADYVVWRKTDGTQPGYDEWRTNFGRTAGSGSGLGAAAGVPEPSTLLMVAAAIAGLGCIRRR